MSYQSPEDYVTVAERIVEFRQKYPEGSLQPADLSKPYSLDSINGNPMFVVVAAAYRSPDDKRPGIGMAYEPVPGATPFTRGSELQNAETAAWGRAIIAALAADAKKGIATAEEVRPRQAEQQQAGRQRPPKQEQPVGDEWASWFDAITERKGDYAALLALYNEAASKGVPAQVLNAIKAEGERAKK